jgi:O-antigen/teichoic acid export membrane protein
VNERGPLPTHAAVSGLVVARNARWNLVGQVLPPVLALLAIPLLENRIGTAQLGLLSLSLMVLGVARDLGFARAATRFVAEALAESDPRRAAAVVWSTAAVQAVLGLLGGAALAILAGWMSHRAEFAPVAPLVRPAFLLTALGMPLALVMSAFRGGIEGSQRFGLSNVVMAPLGVAGFLLPLAAVWAGWGLLGGVALLVVARLAALLAMIVLARRCIPELFSPAGRPGDLRSLLHFGGWATVSTVVSPVLSYLDRWLLTFLGGVAAVGYYFPTFELANRLQMIPLSIGGALFPALTALGGAGRHDEAGRMAARSARYIAVALTPPVFFLVMAASPLLRLWMNGDFADAGSIALRILAVGVLVNALAHVPFSVIQGVGRADLTAKLHLAELPLYGALAWVLIARWGISGAAAAWTVRVTVDTAILMVLARRYAPEMSGVAEPSRTVELVGLTCGGLVIAAGASRFIRGDLGQVALFGCLAIAITGALWALVLGKDERAGLMALLRPSRRS